MPQLNLSYYIKEVISDILSYNLPIIEINHINNMNDKLIFIRINMWSFGFIFKGKRSFKDITSNSDNEDIDKTPTNEIVSDDGSTPTEALSDDENSDAKDILETVKRALNGEDVDKDSLDDIKEEFKNVFEDHQTDVVGALNEVKDMLEDELSPLGTKSLAALTEALEDISSDEHPNKRARTSEASENSDSNSATKDDSSSETTGDSIDDILEWVKKLFEV